MNACSSPYYLATWPNATCKVVKTPINKRVTNLPKGNMKLRSQRAIELYLEVGSAKRTMAIHPTTPFSTCITLWGITPSARTRARWSAEAMRASTPALRRRRQTLRIQPLNKANLESLPKPVEIDQSHTSKADTQLQSHR